MPPEGDLVVATVRRAGASCAVAFDGRILVEVVRHRTRGATPEDELIARYSTSELVVDDAHPRAAEPGVRVVTVAGIRHHFSACTLREVFLRVLHTYPQLRRFVCDGPGAPPRPCDRRRTIVLPRTCTSIDVPVAAVLDAPGCVALARCTPGTPSPSRLARGADPSALWGPSIFVQVLTVALGMTGLGIHPTPYDQDPHPNQGRTPLRRPR